MKKILNEEYTTEFKEQAVRHAKMGKSIGLVAKELGLVEQTLRNWVKLATAGKLHGTSIKVVTPEQMDLSRLRAENVRLKRECEILKNVCILPGVTRAASFQDLSPSEVEIAIIITGLFCLSRSSPNKVVNI